VCLTACNLETSKPRGLGPTWAAVPHRKCSFIHSEIRIHTLQNSPLEGPSVSFVRSGQLQCSGGSHNSLRTRLGAAFVYTHNEEEEGGWMYCNTVIYKQYVFLRVRLNGEIVGLTDLDKTKRNIVFLCIVLKVMWYSSSKFSLLINLLYFVLQTCYIMFVKLYYWNYSDYWGPQYFPRGPHVGQAWLI
jgi:hypothetical protein